MGWLGTIVSIVVSAIGSAAGYGIVRLCHFAYNKLQGGKVSLNIETTKVDNSPEWIMDVTIANEEHKGELKIKEVRAMFHRRFGFLSDSVLGVQCHFPIVVGPKKKIGVRFSLCRLHSDLTTLHCHKRISRREYLPLWIRCTTTHGRIYHSFRFRYPIGTGVTWPSTQELYGELRYNRARLVTWLCIGGGATLVFLVLMYLSTIGITIVLILESLCTKIRICG